MTLIPLQFLPDVVITTDTTPNCCTFYIQSSGFPLSFSGTWSGAMYKVYITV